jgi:hypothetical protein
MPHQVIYQPAFTAEVNALGGYKHLDRAIDPAVDALSRNPYAAHKFETPLVSFRYIITKPVEELPSYAIVFVIAENDDVLLEHIEENLSY